MILIYTHFITPRVTYSIDVVFNNVLQCEYQLTSDIEFYHASLLPKFAYTNAANNFDVCICSDKLLFETGIKKQLPIPSGEYLNFPMFFSTSVNSFLPYDIFATVFYFASRYEEYLPNEIDVHQRFKANQSIAFKHNFLNKPFLNYLIDDFSEKLKTKFPSLNFGIRNFNVVSTIDIDNAFAYANKGFRRNVGGLLKDISQLNFDKIIPRLKSNIHSKYDPYNTFDIINSISEQSQTALHYFVLIADYSAYDKNPHYTNKGFRELLKGLSNKYVMGLHPSYNSSDQLAKIGLEKKRLEDIIEKKVTSARCHFLRLKFPDTYREFIEQGITDDYTMIYASQCGFRTGLCTPYKWFDLEKNEPTNLTIHPSTLMEGVLRDYNKLSATEAEWICSNLKNEVAKFGGEFVSIFHNDSFVNEQQQWIDVYKTLLQKPNNP